MDLAPSLPDDVLADVLRRLAPHGLAASRCVCKSWRRVVDGHRLLRADLLPLSLGGILLNFLDLWFTKFLSRPTTGAAISGRLDYVAALPGYFPPLPYVRDHCNGLLLLDHCVVNPATRQWAPLPPAPDLPRTPPGIFWTHEYLVFDPALSPNYFELFIMPNVPFKLNDECEEFQWPPSTLILPVFSSKTGSWEERTFDREGEAAGTLSGMMVASLRAYSCRQCAYWRGALYICCSDCFVLRISLSDNKYRAIRLPTDVPEDDQQLYVGKSIKGIYCASLFCFRSQLQVWFLNDLTEWVLKHDRDISPILPNLNYDEQCDRPWILQQFNYSDEDDSVVENNNETIVEEEKFEWDSDNDNVLEPGSGSEESCIYFLGFHPYKEVVFLSLWDRVLAYHWTSSKLQDLGKFFPVDRHLAYHNPMLEESFPYTPCWLGELPEKLHLEA